MTKEGGAAWAAIPIGMPGHADGPAAYFAWADIAAHCAVLAEPFGQVVAKAMAASCAVVAGRGGPAHRDHPATGERRADCTERPGRTTEPAPAGPGRVRTFRRSAAASDSAVLDHRVGREHAGSVRARDAGSPRPAVAGDPDGITA